MPNNLQVQPLQANMPIVNADGTPTQAFIRWAQQQIGGNFSNVVPSSRKVSTGHGLTGGGDLTQDRTIALDATLGDLNDVDETTTPPADGQVLTYVFADLKWEPKDPTGGGGAVGEAAWKVDAVGTGAPQNVTIPDINPTEQSVMVFVNGLRWPTTDYSIAGNVVTLTTNSAGDAIEIIGPLGKTGAAPFLVTATGTAAPQNINLPYVPKTAQEILIFINGLRWPLSDYTIAGNVVTLTTNTAGDPIEIVGPLGFVISGAKSAARYWTLSMFEWNTGDVPSIAEILFTDTSGGTPVPTGISASSSTLPISNVLDGNPNTFWYTSTAGNPWIIIDFGAPVNLASITLQARNDGFYGQTPYGVLISSGAALGAFTPIATGLHIFAAMAADQLVFNIP